MRLREMRLYWTRFPLRKPYRVSYRVYEAFEPIIVEARDEDGRVGRRTIDNAGEFNGYLKPKAPLFSEPLAFADGSVVIRAGYRPDVDRAALAAHTENSERFAATRAATAAAGG